LTAIFRPPPPDGRVSGRSLRPSEATSRSACGGRRRRGRLTAVSDAAMIRNRGPWPSMIRRTATPSTRGSRASPSSAGAAARETIRLQSGRPGNWKTHAVPCYATQRRRWIHQHFGAWRLADHHCQGHKWLRCQHAGRTMLMTASTTWPHARGNLLHRAWHQLWQAAIDPDGPGKHLRSCYELAEEYRIPGMPASKCVARFINRQAVTTGGAGFALGLPGAGFGLVAVPTDFLWTGLVHMRMVATIALLHGWDARSDQVETVAKMALLAASGTEAALPGGVRFGHTAGLRLLAKFPARTLRTAHGTAAPRMLARAANAGFVNLARLAPILGAVVGAGLNSASTLAIGRAANFLLKGGPRDRTRAAGDVSPGANLRLVTPSSRAADLISTQGSDADQVSSRAAEVPAQQHDDPAKQ
jgi:hypothetical protein